MLRRSLLIAVATIAWITIANPTRADEFGQVLASFGNLSTVAGTALVDDGGVSGWNPVFEGGLAVSAELSRPHMAMADVEGNIFIADKDAHAVRWIGPTGTIHTVAGTNVAGFNGDGPGPSQQLNEPNGLFTFADGTTFILDLANSSVRRLDTSGNLTTIFTDPAGLSVGRGLWVSADESLIYFASGSEVRQWTPDEGISLLASGFAELGNITVDPLDGFVVATDRFGHEVRKIFPDGSSLRIAGNGTTSGGGSGLSALATGLNEVRTIQYDTTGGYYLGTHRDSQIWYVDTEGTIHLLIDGDRSNDTHAGDGLPLTTPGQKISEPRAVTLGFDRQMIITENDGGYIRVVDRALNIPGDFDYDGQLTAADIDLLTRVVQVGTNPYYFNLDPRASRLVDQQDLAIWVEQLADTQFGDANLDGRVDEADFEIWNAHQFEVGTGWATGDFNGDGYTDGIDFDIWNAHKSLSATNESVPEPATSLLVAWAVGLAVGSARRRWHSRQTS
ncbi:MAG: hypothetical protein KDA60_12625 [Planctomycetales bacterium]|nr:hypothetical protein [Planctomycetales bacterium]